MRGSSPRMTSEVGATKTTTASPYPAACPDATLAPTAMPPREGPMTGLASFDLMGWIDENHALLKPPMLGKPVWRNSDFVVMVLMGPVVRRDFHVNPFEEILYQLKGDMTLKVFEDGRVRDVAVPEGNMLLIPPGLPHSPQRPVPGSIGLVVERSRPAGRNDVFEWYCERCAAKLHRCELHLSTFATERNRLFADYDARIAGAPCPSCGTPVPKNVPVAA